MNTYMNDIIWNKVIIDEFVELACLSETEEMILRTWAKGWSITKQSMEFHLSESSIKKIRHRIKIKYDNVQGYSNILPIRNTYNQIYKA